MGWNIRITDEAKKDYSKIDGSMRKQVLAGIIKVSKAPLPSPNGYGKPLGNKNGNDLTSEDWLKLGQASGRLSNIPLYIECSEGFYFFLSSA